MSSKRGFAGMSKEARQEAARKGGIAAHTKGVAHQWTVEDARAAGRKGGLASFAKKLRRVKADEKLVEAIEQSPFSQGAAGPFGGAESIY